MKVLQKIIYRLNFKISGILKIKNSLKEYFKLSDTLLLVYSMGKTGSSSVYYTLMRDFPFSKVIHVHFLSDYWYSWFSNQNKKNLKKDRNQILSDKAKKFIKKNKKLFSITIIRDPFSRSISDYFHSKRDILSSLSDNQIIKEISESYYIQSNSMDWFEKDFNSFFNIDIYKMPFNTNKGWEVYKLGEERSILIIRIDVLTSSFKKAFFNLTGLHVNKLFITNRREDDNTLSERYKLFKSNYYESEESVNRKLSSKFVKHFFNKNQIQTLREKYTVSKFKKSVSA